MKIHRRPRGQRKGGADIGATRESPLVHKSHQAAAVIKPGWICLVWGFIILMLKEIIPAQLFFLVLQKMSKLGRWN